MSQPTINFGRTHHMHEPAEKFPIKYGLLFELSSTRQGLTLLDKTDTLLKFGTLHYVTEDNLLITSYLFIVIQLDKHSAGY